MLASLIIAFSITSHGLTPQSYGQWKDILTDSGITVSILKPDNRSLPIVRATGILKCNLYHLLAILDDVPKHVQWMTRIKQARTLSQQSVYARVLYHHFDVPWPAYDRDVVSKVKASISNDGKKVRVTLESTANHTKPKRKRIIRVPRFLTRIDLVYLSSMETHATLITDIDPGGAIPDWIVTWLLKRIPKKLVERLRTQLGQTQSNYTDFINRHNTTRLPRKGERTQKPGNKKSPTSNPAQSATP
ncbi:MAG: START domain-containing protein [Myxococcota bacterium]|nr:START domain-containing protein [Myxococcota bacterium]